MTWLRGLVIVAAVVGFVGVAADARADTIVSLVGDKDGFGLAGAPAVPADGTLWRDGLGGVFFSDYRDAGDLANAPFTDQWFSDAAINYTHAYDLLGGTALGGTLAIQIAGVADNRGPWDVKVNGTTVGQIPTNSSANAFQEILLYEFTISAALLTEFDSILLNINVPGVTDGYSINFSELTIETSAAVPEPATLALFGLGAAGLALRRRKRRTA